VDTLASVVSVGYPIKPCGAPLGYCGAPLGYYGGAGPERSGPDKMSGEGHASPGLNTTRRGCDG